MENTDRNNHWYVGKSASSSESPEPNRKVIGPMTWIEISEIAMETERSSDKPRSNSLLLWHPQVTSDRWETWDEVLSKLGPSGARATETSSSIRTYSNQIVNMDRGHHVCMTGAQCAVVGREIDNAKGCGNKVQEEPDGGLLTRNEVKTKAQDKIEIPCKSVKNKERDYEVEDGWRVNKKEGKAWLSTPVEDTTMAEAWGCVRLCDETNATLAFPKDSSDMSGEMLSDCADKVAISVACILWQSQDVQFQAHCLDGLEVTSLGRVSSNIYSRLMAKIGYGTGREACTGVIKKQKT